MPVFPENPNISTLDRINIEKFCSYYFDAKEKINKRDFKGARSDYVEMLSIFKYMKKEELDTLHLNVAHHAVQEVFDEITQKEDIMLVSPHSFRIMFIFTIIVLLIGVGFILKPSLSGLVVLDSTPVYTLDSREFYISGLTVWDLENFFSSPSDMSFLVTDSEILDLQLKESRLYIMPKKQGDAQITLIASADGEITRVPIIIRIN